jgi:hypothetical protein
MIDDNALKVLMEVHTHASDRPACITYRDKAIVHSTMLMLELPATEVQLKKRTWPCPPWGNAPQWREQLPKDLKYLTTSAIRGTDKEDREYVQFEALDSSATCYMQGSLYDFLRDQLDNPSFRIMDAPSTVAEGQRLGIGLFVDGELVGAVSPLLPPEME